MGNSEVGHLNIGAGRIVFQDSSLIDQSIRTGEFFDNEILLAAIERVKTDNTRLHLLGLTSQTATFTLRKGIISRCSKWPRATV